MKHFLQIIFWIGYGLSITSGYCQRGASNTIHYKVTYTPASGRYTAWVVPDYNLPNPNNSSVIEKGATAQFTLKVPAAFIISDIQDIKGSWEKQPLKLGPGQAKQNWGNVGLDPAFAYYVIGKFPTETDYGQFKAGVAVPLFTFSGNGCFGPVSPLPANDPFIKAADQVFSLNVGNSFYSRSGQPAGGNVVPAEQFVDKTGPEADCRIVETKPASSTPIAVVKRSTVVCVPVVLKRRVLSD
ncbi:hypothetical protein [Nibrella saemangeumensis]